MNKLLLTTALLAFLAVPAMADNDGPGVSGGGGGINNSVTSSYGDGGYQHQPADRVEELEIRIARLQAQLANCQSTGTGCGYGGGQFPVDRAIIQTQAQLRYFLAERAAGRVYGLGAKIPNNAPIPKTCSGSLYC